MSFPENISKHRRAVLEMLGDAFRDPGKRSAMRTRGVSMRPFLRERDEIVITARPPEAIAVGELIAFRSGDMLLAHRVVGRIGEGGAIQFYEKGDNNMYLTAVEASRVLGVVVEVVTEARRIDLRRARFRVLGRVVAVLGRKTVGFVERLRALGRRVVRPGTASSRCSRRLVHFVVHAPSHALLWAARRLF